MGTLICKKERNMLKESHIIDSYPELKELLLKYVSITQEILDEDIEISKSLKEFFSTGVYKKIIEVAYNEWFGESNRCCEEKLDVKKYVKCGICGQKNSEVYYIKNKINGNRINVGSTCIGNFPELKDEAGNDFKKFIDDEKKEIERTKKFNLKFKNYNQRILYYKSAIDKSEFIINFTIYSSIVNSIEKIESLRRKYIEGEISKGCFTDIDKEFLNIDRCVTVDVPKCNKYLYKEKYACTKEIADWIISSTKKNKDDIIRKIRINNSVLNNDTISEISYIPFIEEHLTEYKSLTKDIFYDIRIYNQMLYVTIKNKYLSEYDFCSTPQHFMKFLGDIVFLNEDERLGKLNLNFLLANVFLLDEETGDNTFYLYKQLSRMFERRYQFVFDYNKNKTFIIDIVSNNCVDFFGTSRIVKSLLNHFENKKLEKSCKDFFDNLKWRNISQDDIEDISKWSKISYIPFIKEHFIEHKSLTKNIFDDIRIDNEKLYVTIKNNYLSNCVFYSTPQHFMKFLGDVIYLNADERRKKLNLNFLLANVFLLNEQTRDSIVCLFNQLNIMFGRKYEFLFDYDNNRTHIIDTASNKCVDFFGTRKIVKHLLKRFENKNLEKSCEIFFDNLKWRNITQDDIDIISQCKDKYKNS